MIGALSPAIERNILLKTFWMLATGLALMALLAGPGRAKEFQTESFKYYITDYQNELGKIAKTVSGKSATDLEAAITAAEATGNARQTAVEVEKLLSKTPSDGQLWLKLAR